MTALKLVHNAHQPTRRDYINHAASMEPRTGVLFSDFIEKTIARKANRMCKNYSRNYKTLIGHLDGFSRTHQATIYTNSVNEYFMDDFILYLQGSGLKQGYIKTLVSLVKAMVKKPAQTFMQLTLLMQMWR